MDPPVSQMAPPSGGRLTPGFIHPDLLDLCFSPNQAPTAACTHQAASEGRFIWDLPSVSFISPPPPPPPPKDLHSSCSGKKWRFLCLEKNLKFWRENGAKRGTRHLKTQFGNKSRLLSVSMRWRPLARSLRSNPQRQKIDPEAVTKTRLRSYFSPDGLRCANKNRRA